MLRRTIAFVARAPRRAASALVRTSGPKCRDESRHGTPGGARHKRRTCSCFFALFFSFLHAEILDRVAVTIGKHVIAESDILLDLRIGAFLDQKLVDASGDQKRKAADRLVDQYLVLQEASTSRQVLPTAADAGQLLDQVKAQYATETEYRAALARYGITEPELSDHLLNGIRAMRFTDLRFRPEVQLSDDDLHEYYDSMAAQWRRANPAQVPTFEASRDQIEKLLTDQRVTQALDRWLGATRSETQILYKDQVFK